MDGQPPIPPKPNNHYNSHQLNTPNETDEAYKLQIPKDESPHYNTRAIWTRAVNVMSGVVTGTKRLISYVKKKALKNKTKKESVTLHSNNTLRVGIKDYPTGSKDHGDCHLHEASNLELNAGRKRHHTSRKRTNYDSEVPLKRMRHIDTPLMNTLGSTDQEAAIKNFKRLYNETMKQDLSYWMEHLLASTAITDIDLAQEATQKLPQLHINIANLTENPSKSTILPSEIDTLVHELIEIDRTITSLDGATISFGIEKSAAKRAILTTLEALSDLKKDVTLSGPLKAPGTPMAQEAPKSIEEAEKIALETSSLHEGGTPPSPASVVTASAERLLSASGSATSNIGQEIEPKLEQKEQSGSSFEFIKENKSSWIGSNSILSKMKSSIKSTSTNNSTTPRDNNEDYWIPVDPSRYSDEFDRDGDGEDEPHAMIGTPAQTTSNKGKSASLINIPTPETVPLDSSVNFEGIQAFNICSFSQLEAALTEVLTQWVPKQNWHKTDLKYQLKYIKFISAYDWATFRKFKNDDNLHINRYRLLGEDLQKLWDSLSKAFDRALDDFEKFGIKNDDDLMENRLHEELLTVISKKNKDTYERILNSNAYERSEKIKQACAQIITKTAKKGTHVGQESIVQKMLHHEDQPFPLTYKELHGWVEDNLISYSKTLPFDDNELQMIYDEYLEQFNPDATK